MSNSGRSGVLVLSMIVLLAVAGISPSYGESGGSIGENLVVTLTVDEGGTSPSRTYRVVTRDDGSPSRLNAGWRVPIPTATFASRDEGDRPGTATSYTYQNIGLTAALETRAIEGRIEVHGNLEISAAKRSDEDAAGGGAPTIGAFQQSFNVLLEPGQPLELAEVSSPRGGTVSVHLRVDRLK